MQHCSPRESPKKKVCYVCAKTSSKWTRRECCLTRLMPPLNIPDKPNAPFSDAAHPGKLALIGTRAGLVLVYAPLVYAPNAGASACVGAF